MLTAQLAEALKRDYGEVGILIARTAQLLSLRRKGGILAVVDSPPAGLLPKDIVPARKNGRRPLPEPEQLWHKLLPGAKVLDYSPTTLAMLASLDGALIVTSKGRIHAYGAIVPSNPSGAEGARTSAARTLSETSQGSTVVKVSADGPIEVWKSGKRVVEF
jgi:hypothetical protein